MMEEKGKERSPWVIKGRNDTKIRIGTSTKNWRKIDNISVQETVSNQKKDGAKAAVHYDHQEITEKDENSHGVRRRGNQN